MKIAVIGATGFVGKNVVNELVNRNHHVQGVSRKESTSEKSNLTYTSKDVFNVDQLSETLKSFDVVVSAYNPGWNNPDIYNEFIKGSQSIQQAVRLSGVKRYIVVGGAGSLYIAEGVQVVDSDTFPMPPHVKPGATAARDYLNILKQEKELDWVFFSPALEMHAGITIGRTGKYRLGKDNPVFNEEKRSIISPQDVAVVIADEIETPKHHQTRFTAAY